MATHDCDVIIIGAGPAGLCAGMYAGRSMLKGVVLEQGLPGGELLNTEVIEDYIGFEHILGYDLAEKFQSHAAKFGADIRTYHRVEKVRKVADGTDGFIFPAASSVAPAGHQFTGSRTFLAYWSWTGFPAFSLPLLEVHKLPLGLQLAGVGDGDGALCAVANWLMKEFG